MFLHKRVSVLWQYKLINIIKIENVTKLLLKWTKKKNSCVIFFIKKILTFILKFLNTFQLKRVPAKPKPHKSYISNFILQSVFQIPNPTSPTPESTHTLVVFFECFHGLVLLRFLLRIHVLLKITVVVVFFFVLLRFVLLHFSFNFFMVRIDWFY